MKPVAFLRAKIDARVMAEGLGVTSRSVRKARQGKENGTTDLIANMSASELGELNAKLVAKQDELDKSRVKKEETNENG